jgi:hypothetical protein
MGALFEESWLESELDRKLPYFLMQIYAYTDYQIWQKLFPETKLALWRREAVFFGATVDLLTSDSPCHCHDFVPVFWSRTGYVQPCSLENGVNNAFAERSWGLKLRSPLAEAFCDDSTLNASVCIQYRRRVATSERNIIALQLGANKFST